MKREQFLRLSVGVVLAPYLARIPAGAPKVIPAVETTLTLTPGYYSAGDILRVSSSGEAIRITKLEGNVATVVRNIGMRRDGASPIFADDSITLVARAQAEGAAL